MRLSLYSHNMTNTTVTSQAGKRSRNSAEFPLLATLLAGPQHGYEMCRTLGESLDSTWRLGKSQIYALLAKMERKGLVSHHRVGQENLPAKNIFSLTPKGRRIVEDWLQEPVHHIRDIRLEFIAKLWFLRKFHPHKESRLIEKQLAVCKTKVMALERLSTSCRGEVEALSIDFRLTATRAAISWLERLPNSAEIGIRAEGD